MDFTTCSLSKQSGCVPRTLFLAAVILAAVVLPVKTMADTADLDELVTQTRDQFGIPGLGVAVFSSNKILFQEAYGVKNTLTQEPLSLTDKFHKGSLAKGMLSFVAAKLVEQGVVQWDTKFFDAAPQLQPGSRTEYHDITLQDLLSHRSTLPQMSYGYEWDGIPGFQGTKKEIRDQFVQWILTQPPLVDDGNDTGSKYAIGDTLYAYSNAGYTTAAYMLETLTNKTWEELIQEHFQAALNFTPGFGWPAKSDPDNNWGHYEDDSGQIVPADIPPVLPAAIEPSGNINMTVPEFASFLQLHLQGLRGQSNYLDAATYQDLHYKFPHSSLGWGNKMVLDKKISLHSGSDHIFYTWVALLPGSDIGFAIMSNAANADSRQGVVWLLAQLIEMYDGFWSYIMEEEERPAIGYLDTASVPVSYLQADGKGQTLTLTWEPVQGAKSYNLLYAPYSGNTDIKSLPIPYSDSQTVSFSLSSQAAYYVAVEAFGKDNISLGVTNVVYFYVF